MLSTAEWLTLVLVITFGAVVVVGLVVSLAIKAHESHVAQVVEYEVAVAENQARARREMEIRDALRRELRRDEDASWEAKHRPAQLPLALPPEPTFSDEEDWERDVTVVERNPRKWDR